MPAIWKQQPLRGSEMSAAQQRDRRWAIVDLRGKHGRIRAVPMPSWAKVAIDAWAVSAEISTGSVFRGVNKGDRVTGDSLVKRVAKGDVVAQVKVIGKLFGIAA